ncbi:uncharacterized protein [Medicago truncatula]|uniref:uncharacterized protein n=1 Tax=Medicago truncatula TaxID=3880 RepID=UPI000D2F18F1|nr:uncharacterized protein LOC112417312 [Medicago truncatula]
MRWHLVKPLKIDNVRLALDSAKDDFLWRPYVQYADKFEMFYPNDETLVPLKKDLDKKNLSFVMSLRVSELVGFESIEQYLPHRVAMQFGMDQDVPACVPRFNENETIAWKNYCRPLSDASLFIPSRFFDAGVTTRYATWWKRSAGSSTCTAHAEIPLEFLHPKLVTFGKPCDYSSKAKGDDIVDGDVEDGLNSEKNSVDIVTGSDNSVEDGLNAEKNMAVDGPSPLLSVAEDGNHVFEDVQSKDADQSMEARLSNDDVCEAETPTERYSFLSEASIADLEQRISQLEIAHTKLKTKRLGLS